MTSFECVDANLPPPSASLIQMRLQEVHRLLSEGAFEEARLICAGLLDLLGDTSLDQVTLQKLGLVLEELELILRADNDDADAVKVEGYLADLLRAPWHAWRPDCSQTDWPEHLHS